MTTAEDKPCIKLLIDTNVWLDYFLGRPRTLADILDLFAIADESERVVLLVSSLSIKDVYFVLGQNMKARAREAGKLAPETVAAAEEASWECVRKIREMALVAPVGANEVFDSFVFKRYHGDFEDDLILGVGNRADVDYVVTGDGGLIKHASGVCVDVKTALQIVSE